MSNRATTLGKLLREGRLEFSDGYRTRHDELGDKGFRIIRAADVSNGRITLGPPDFVRAQHAHAIGDKAARSGDVVLTTKGTVGRVALVTDLGQACVYSPQLCYFRVADSADIESAYLAHWLRSPEFTLQSSHLMHRTDMAPYISLTDLRSVKITLPERRVQRAIAEVLGALDDKIAANGHLVRAADALVRLEFASLAPRSPASGRLTDLAEFVNGRAFTKDASGSGRVVIRIAELNSGIGNSTVRSEAHVGPEHLAGPGDLLFAWSGSLTVHRWYRAEGIVNQHIFKVLPKNGWPTWAVHCALNERLPYFKGVAADRATTMGHIQRRHLEEAIHLPQLVEIQQASTRLDPVWRRALAAEVESEQLALMRDTLLPRLMSGELRVKDAERAVEEVT